MIIYDHKDQFVAIGSSFVAIGSWHFSCFLVVCRLSSAICHRRCLIVARPLLWSTSRSITASRSLPPTIASERQSTTFVAARRPCSSSTIIIVIGRPCPVSMVSSHGVLCRRAASSLVAPRPSSSMSSCVAAPDPRLQG